MRQPWDSSSRRLRPVHCSPTAPSCHFSIQCGGDMRAITNIATTMPVTRPALQRELLHRAAARLAPMTKGASKAARTRKRPRLRRSQAWVGSSYILAALSPAFLDLRACNMPTRMSSTRVLCSRTVNPAQARGDGGGVLGARECFEGSNPSPATHVLEGTLTCGNAGQGPFLGALLSRSSRTPATNLPVAPKAARRVPRRRLDRTGRPATITRTAVSTPRGRSQPRLVVR